MIPALGVGLQSAGHEMSQRLGRACLSRRPVEAAGPVGPRRVQAPIVDVVTGDLGGARHVARAQCVGRRLGLGQEGLQEGGEDLVGLTRPVQHGARPAC